VEGRFDGEVDALVAGSGAAGLVTALSAGAHGLEALVVEQAEYLGGTTSCSGGGLWRPNNPVPRRAGMKDTAGDARRCLDAILALANSSVARAPRVPRRGFQGRGAARARLPTCAPAGSGAALTTAPELPVGSTAGRPIAPPAIDTRVPEKDRRRIRRITQLPVMPFGMWMTIDEARD